jgi:hypothetical protein
MSNTISVLTYWAGGALSGRVIGNIFQFLVYSFQRHFVYKKNVCLE